MSLGNVLTEIACQLWLLSSCYPGCELHGRINSESVVEPHGQIYPWAQNNLAAYHTGFCTESSMYLSLNVIMFEPPR
jgi:hypothetical protein